MLCAIAYATGCGDAAGPTKAGPLARVDILTGDSQRGVAGKELPNALEVKVTDASGHAVSGAVVNFVVVAGGGHVFAGAAATDEDGVAKERWTLGTNTAEPQKVEVRAVDSKTGEGHVYATFQSTAIPDVPFDVRKTSGDGQIGAAGAPLQQPIVATVVDQYGNGVPAATVAFSTTDGQVTPPSAVTDNAGHAGAQWTLGTLLNATQRASVSVQGLMPAVFSAVATTAPNAQIAIIRGASSQIVRSSERLPDSVVARVTLPDGRPLSGVIVRFTPGVGYGVANPTAALTDANGLAATAWTLGSVAGSQQIVVSLDGGASAVLTVDARTPGFPTAITLLRGGNQEQIQGHLLPDTIAARVTDYFGAPVANREVGFKFLTAPGALTYLSGPFTDDQGVVRVVWTLSESTGPQTLRIYANPSDPTAWETQARLDISALARSSCDYTITKVSGDNQSAPVGSALPQPFVVRVTGPNGVAAAVRIAWNTPGQTEADGIRELGASLTDANGLASLRYTLAGARYTQTVRAAISPIGGCERLVSFTATPTP